MSATDNTMRAELADTALADAIEATCTGYVEWRVQNPVDRSYCIAFDRSQSTLPKGEAEAWLADHRRRFPDSQFAGYEVAEVRVFNQAEELALEAARRLRARADTARQVAEWIGVGERMPGEHEVVLCSAPGALGIPYVAAGWYDEERRGWWETNTHWTDAHDGHMPGVTHWMPLPAAPKATEAK